MHEVTAELASQTKLGMPSLFFFAADHCSPPMWLRMLRIFVLRYFLHAMSREMTCLVRTCQDYHDGCIDTYPARCSLLHSIMARALPVAC